MNLLKYCKLIILIFIALVSSCANNTNSIAVRNWHIINEPGKSLESVVHNNGWNPVHDLSAIKLRNPSLKRFKFIWLKGEFNITGDPKKYYGLTTGTIRFADKMYINEHFISALPIEEVKWIPSPRNYLIPKNILKKGNNTIYIQLGLYSKYSGGISGDVLIQGEDDFCRSQLTGDLIYEQLPIGIGVLFTGLLIILFIVFLLDRKEMQLLLYFILILFLNIIYTFAIFTTQKLLSHDIFYIIQISLSPLFAIFFILLFQSLYKIYVVKLNLFIISLMSILLLFIVLTTNETNSNVVSSIMVILSIVIPVPFFVFLIYRLHSINPDRFLFFTIIALSATALLISIIKIDSIFSGKHYFGLPKIYISSVLVILFAGVFISREILKRKRELKLLYDKVAYREGQKRDFTVTDTSKEKLGSIIEFLDNNYKSDISREGLAAAVGMSANYLGSIFRTYTGQKINDYINRLRIDEAIQKLEEDNSRVIDIAFSVGFESIVTFNRAFKKNTGITPTEYRENL